jgi:uncharacterized protein (TIGR02996 family)
LPEGVVDDETLRRAVIASPDDDAPREAYAAWMLAQQHEFARTLGAFLTAQLRVAQAYRADPRANVSALRSWRGDRTPVSIPEFRSGDVLRQWLVDDLGELLSRAVVGWPQIYRGFVERVAMRAIRFIEVADELFHAAPIRSLVLIGVPAVVDQLAACPHLARILSLSLPRNGGADELTDLVVTRLLKSPHLRNLVHLRLVDQVQLTPRAYERIATAETLPMLSHFEVLARLPQGQTPPRQTYIPRSWTERMSVYDTPIRVAAPAGWITDLERTLGYVPSLHADEHYGRGLIDLEAVLQHPIAHDADVMARRGRAVPEVPDAQEHAP